MKLPGIESAAVSLKTAIADIRLEPENTITMPQLRELLKKNGYPTRDAQVSGRGKVINRDGTRVLDLLNGSTIELVDTAARLAPNEIVNVTGTSRVASKGTEQLTVKADGVK